MNRWRVVPIIVVSTFAMLFVGWCSRLPFQAMESRSAMLRLSWRMRPERNELCRDRTQAELDALPVHMRTPRVCETRVVPYRLIVQIGAGRADTSLILPAGAKHDRPVYVLRDTLLAPGAPQVRVVFERADSSLVGPLRFERTVRLQAGFIELITLQEETGRLVLRSAR